MTNNLKLKTFKSKPITQRYAVVQQDKIVRYFKNRAEGVIFLNHLKRGGGFSHEFEIPRFLLQN